MCTQCCPSAFLPVRRDVFTAGPAYGGGGERKPSFGEGGAGGVETDKTPEQDYKLVLFSGYTTSADSEVYSVIKEPGVELDAYLQDALCRSDFRADVPLLPEARYVVLSTCEYVYENARYVLHGMLVPVPGDGP